MYRSIMIHLSFLDKLLDHSNKIISALKKNEIEEALFLVNNRERLIGIINTLEKKIIRSFENNNSKDVSISEVFQVWKSDTEILAKKVFHLDQLSFEHLSEIKKATKEKISEIFVLNKFHSAYLTNSFKL